MSVIPALDWYTRLPLVDIPVNGDLVRQAGEPAGCDASHPMHALIMPGQWVVKLRRTFAFFW